ncbi:MAG: DUF2184 domain-containing protein [Candidatus Symbiopectobacterium sp. Dall1.0]|nr:DUF2184 domain-containing protein [Candidatus Symbiopectobacterium sp. Dall1.0]
MPKIVRLTDGEEVELTSAIENIQKSEQVTLSDSDAVFFQRQLEYIEQQSYDILYPELEARECFGVDNSGGPGVTTLTYRSYDHVGKAQVINARATDLPKSNISGKEESITVKSVGTAYDFDIDEVNAAAVTGMPLEGRKANAATHGYEQYINSAVWYGDKLGGFVGFFGNKDITRASVAKGASGKTEWEHKTPGEVLADLNNATGAMYDSTLKIMRPSEVWLSVAKWNYIRSTPRSENSDKTILQYFVENNEFIRGADAIKPLNAVKGYGDKGSECMIVVCKEVRGHKTMRIREPLPLEWMPVQLHGLTYEIPGRGRFAGLQVMYPAAISINSGI